MHFRWISFKKKSTLFCSFPFDSKTPCGFLAIGFYEVLAGCLTGELFYDTLALTAGLCLYAIEFAADTNAILENLNCDLEIRDSQQHTHAEHVEIKKKFNEIIRFHSEVIELSLMCTKFCKSSSKPFLSSSSHLVFSIVSRIWIAVQYFRTFCMQLYRSAVCSFK